MRCQLFLGVRYGLGLVEYRHFIKTSDVSVAELDGLEVGVAGTAAELP